MTRVRLAGMLVLTMMTTNDNAQAKDVWLDRPGIVIQARHRLSQARAIPLNVTLSKTDY
jgi:hypothetical protein